MRKVCNVCFKAKLQEAMLLGIQAGIRIAIEFWCRTAASLRLTSRCTEAICYATVQLLVKVLFRWARAFLEPDLAGLREPAAARLQQVSSARPATIYNCFFVNDYCDNLNFPEEKSLVMISLNF